MSHRSGMVPDGDVASSTDRHRTATLRPRRDAVGLRHDRRSPPRSAPTSPRRSRRTARRVERGVREFAASGPAAGRGRDPGRLVERQLQGRPGDAGRRQGRPDQPAHPGHRPRRARSSRAPTRRSRSGRPCWPMATTSASSRHGGYTRIPARAGGLGRAAGARAVAARRDGHRDGRVHGRRCPSWRSRTAGFSPDDGPVLVTGASGGVGGTALAILADRGYEVWAATGKPDEAERLTGAGRGRDPDPGRGDRRGQAARVGTMGRGRRRGRRGDPAVRAADAADRRRGRGQRQRRRPEARDDGLPVHPARRRAARDGLGHRADRPAPRPLGPAGDRPAAARARRALPPRSRSTPSTRRSTGSWPARPAVAGSSASGS